MPKKRTLQQKTEAESKAELMKLLSRWIVNPLTNEDFGFDFEVRIAKDTNENNQEVTEISFYIQNKSSIISKGDKAEEDLDVDDWKLYSGQRIPVVIIKYDVQQKIFFWEIAQEYVLDVLDKKFPNWKRQKTKRIILSKKLENLKEFEEAIIRSQKRITRYHSLNLKIGEGLNITQEDLQELTKSKDRFLSEYKSLSLQTAYLESKKDNSQKAFELLMEVYNSPKNDEAKVRAIIGLIFGLNISKLEENAQIVALSDEAVKIADELKLNYLKEYVKILRNKALLYAIIRKISQIQISLSIQSKLDQQPFSFFYNKEFIKLNSFRESVIDDINNSLKFLLEKGHFYYYIAAIPEIIDVVSFQTMHFAAFDREIINQEKNAQRQLIQEAEFILEKINEIDLSKLLLKSLANYYYSTLETNKAKEYFDKAISIAIKDQDIKFANTIKKIREEIEKRPDPYEASESKPIDEMTVEEYQKITQKLLELQGISLNNKLDPLTQSIAMGLHDLNPKQYFKHCEHLHIGYLGTSPVGASIGLPSLGSKFIWCKYCKGSLSGFNLLGLFKNFKEQNCTNCKYHKPRNENWVCRVKWVKEQENSPDFKKVLDNVKNIGI